MLIRSNLQLQYYSLWNSYMPILLHEHITRVGVVVNNYFIVQRLYVSNKTNNLSMLLVAVKWQKTCYLQHTWMWKIQNREKLIVMWSQLKSVGMNPCLFWFLVYLYLHIFYPRYMLQVTRQFFHHKFNVC